MRPASCLVMSLVLAATLASPARAGDEASLPGAGLVLAPPGPSFASLPGDDEASWFTTRADLPFGAEDGRWWSVGGGITHNFDGATDANFTWSYTYFIAENVEFTGELGLWHYNQPGDNALAINPCMVFRYHWYNDQAWTLYVDAGIGLLFATDNVPDSGTSFNFTPRFGVGLTRRLFDDVRLQVGVRWSHVSNARIIGDGDNPARDGPMLYAAVVFPF